MFCSLEVGEFIKIQRESLSASHKIFVSSNQTEELLRVNYFRENAELNAVQVLLCFLFSFQVVSPQNRIQRSSKQDIFFIFSVAILSRTVVLVVFKYSIFLKRSSCSLIFAALTLRENSLKNQMYGNSCHVKKIPTKKPWIVMESPCFPQKLSMRKCMYMSNWKGFFLEKKLIILVAISWYKFWFHVTSTFLDTKRSAIPFELK